MLLRIFAFTMLISVPAFADDCAPTVVDPNLLRNLENVSKQLNVDCPGQVNAADLCAAVSSQHLESNPSQNTRYAYQTKIYRAACVNSRVDTPEIIQAKIQNFWNRFHHQLNCSSVDFTVRNGHILKLAVERNSRDFVNDAVRKWKVNLNHLDPSDKKTVLDYIEAEIVKSRGTNLEPVLQRYFTLFRSNGAKFSREI